MRIALYSPYFPKHVGGGEKYLLDTALALSQYGNVSLAISGSSLSKSEKTATYKKYERFMGQDLRSLNLISSPLGTTVPALEKLVWTRQFDLLYFITDGSFFPSLAERNVMHIQTPLMRSPFSLTERLKHQYWQFVNTNSDFTRKVVEQSWGISVDAVHHPLVDVLPLQLLAQKTKKQKIILHVGRFFRQLHSKRQDVLVRFFKKLRQEYPQETRGWKLVLIGSVEDEAYAASVRKLAQGAPIEIIHSVSRTQLNHWYAKASVYWHATGYGLSESKEPEKMEHFGISTVEAMAAGAVPVVIGQGGQPEAVGADLRELLWTDEKSCLEKTVRVMNNTGYRQKYSQLAQFQSQRFGRDVFEKNIRLMLEELSLI